MRPQAGRRPRQRSLPFLVSGTRGPGVFKLIPEAAGYRIARPAGHRHRPQGSRHTGVGASISAPRGNRAGIRAVQRFGSVPAGVPVEGDHVFAAERAPGNSVGSGMSRRDRSRSHRDRQIKTLSGANQERSVSLPIEPTEGWAGNKVTPPGNHRTRSVGSNER